VRDPTVGPKELNISQAQERASGGSRTLVQARSTGAYPAFVAHADIIKLLIATIRALSRTSGALFIDNASVSLVKLDSERRPRVFRYRLESSAWMAKATDS